MIDYTSIIVTTTKTGHNLSIIDTCKGTTLTGQSHMINLNVTEAPVITGDMHHALYHATIMAYGIHPQTGTPKGTLTGTPHTVTDVTHP